MPEYLRCQCLVSPVYICNLYPVPSQNARTPQMSMSGLSSLYLQPIPSSISKCQNTSDVNVWSLQSISATYTQFHLKMPEHLRCQCLVSPVYICNLYPVPSQNARTPQMSMSGLSSLYLQPIPSSISKCQNTSDVNVWSLQSISVTYTQFHLKMPEYLRCQCLVSPVYICNLYSVPSQNARIPQMSMFGLSSLYL